VIVVNVAMMLVKMLALILINAMTTSLPEDNHFAGVRAYLCMRVRVQSKRSLCHEGSQP